MKLSNIISESAKPALYEKGNATMWTDEYISNQLLHVHLSSETDLASRKTSTIETTLDWILSKCPNKSLNILDLGCGPGLYTKLLAQKGHKVTGVDFSKTSIDYANEHKDGLDIEYIQADYRDLKLEANHYDLIMIIFTDLGVLFPDERNNLFKLIHTSLKNDGLLIFDLMNDTSIESKLSPKTWETCESGFWRPNPYLALSESFYYEDEKVILYQHNIAEENKDVSTYRFWTHFFTESEIREIAETHGFKVKEITNNVIPDGDLHQGKDVSFCVSSK